MIDENTKQWIATAALQLHQPHRKNIMNLAKIESAAIAALILTGIIALGFNASTPSSNDTPVVASAQAAAPVYLTPKGPTTFKRAGAACLGWVDMAFVDDRIKTGRCVIFPVGMPVEVVDRMWLPDTGVTNMVCVKPPGRSGSRCVWTYIENLDVVAQ